MYTYFLYIQYQLVSFSISLMPKVVLSRNFATSRNGKTRQQHELNFLYTFVKLKIKDNPCSLQWRLLDDDDLNISYFLSVI